MLLEQEDWHQSEASLGYRPRPFQKVSGNLCDYYLRERIGGRKREGGREGGEREKEKEIQFDPCGVLLHTELNVII